MLARHAIVAVGAYEGSGVVVKNYHLATLASLLAVVSCSVTAPTDTVATASAIGTAPTNFRQQIVARAKSEYFDPYSIRSAEITEPFPMQHVTAGHYWVVCVRANAKNRFGAYVGVTTDAYGFRNGKLVEKSGHPETYCNGRSYLPFPELEAIT